MPAPLDAQTAAPKTDWWRQAVVYQIYPRSFADANGDGIGDLAGIQSRIPYLRELGVDAVWLSPFYPSALADGGYDVDDYRDVDPKIGTLARVRRDGRRAARGRHQGDRRHRPQPLVEPARVVPGGAGRRPGIAGARPLHLPRREGENGERPPVDWTAMFGGSAWEPVGDGQWYLHLFAPEQPDFNWDNPEVRDDFLTTLRFWSDRGVDGFRIDVANALAKDLTPPLPTQEELDDESLPDGAHRLLDRDEVHEIYREWREVFNAYDPPRTAVAEAWVPARRRSRYASPEGLGQAFNFDLLQRRLGRRRVPQDHRREPRAGRGSRRVLHLGVLQPRRRPPRDPVRAARPATDGSDVAG